MPPSAKRSQRIRREARRDVSPTPPSHEPDPSPSRPAKRRKKDVPLPPAPEVVEEDDSVVTADQSGLNGSDDDQLVSQITQHLFSIKDNPVQASRDHANAIYEANKDGVKAYAKVAAQDWTFYVTKLAVNIGRSSEPTQHAPEDSRVAEDDDFVHIDLGPSKTVSRQHARIYFNSKEEKWFLEVNGRNGVKVDGSLLKTGNEKALSSGEVVDVGGIEMMFVLPSEISPLHIHPVYLQRAGLPAPDLSSPHTAASADAPASSQGTARGSRFPLPQAIAPAPPDYKRPGTPPSARSRRTVGATKSPHHSSGGTLVYSYAQMITQAIMNTPDEKLNLNGIYNFITSNYSYYRNQQAAGWQNSIRHNLSLNKAFDKVARSTDEPGKGMKWQIVPEAKEEMIRSAYKGGRGGHRGSSAPSSPSQLNYITHGPRDMAAREPGSARKRKASPSSPQPSSALRASQSTPDRARRGSARTAPATDDSPLPRPKRSSAGYQPQSPTLTSSYLPEEGTSFVTPAPHRIHPKLAPPSTAQRPSQHMPTSSPAPFWKYADIGSTPLKQPAPFDGSPTKHSAEGLVQSSSPPPVPGKSPVASPSRRPASEAKEAPSMAEEEEEQGFDLAKGFQSIGSYHAPVSRGLSVASAMNGTQ